MSMEILSDNKKVWNPILLSLNKIDDPFELLVWFSDWGLSIYKFERVGCIRIGNGTIKKRLKEENLPYTMEKEIKKKLGIKGTLPYQIRSMIWKMIHKENEKCKPKPKNGYLRKKQSIK